KRSVSRFRASFSRLEQAREPFPVLPEKEDPKQRYHDGGRETFGRHQDVKRPDIENNRAKNGESERNKFTDEQEQSTQKLHSANRINVAAIEKSFQVESGCAFRKRRHRKETEESVGPEKDEDEPE